MKISRLRAASFTLVLGLTLIVHAQTAPAMVDNPLYASWAKFKVGSSQTSSATVPGKNGVTVERTITTTLKAITPDTVTTESTIIEDGDKQDFVKTSKIPAKVEVGAATPGGHESITVMSRKFECMTHELKPATFGDDGNVPATATGYFTDEVPGCVRLVIRIGDREFTSDVTSFEKK